MDSSTSDIPKQYDPTLAQQTWFAHWESNGYFEANPNPDKQQHTIMIPLPNVTGVLHMGHALNCTIQDLLTRWKRMQGFEALWMPGTDHAGIATQAVVERRMLEEEGLTRHDIGREALINRIWKWKDHHEQRILSQLKMLGASCDWRRVRFTLDDVCSQAVRQTFFSFFKDGKIYRGKRLVNWDTYLQTAVADDEVFEEEVQGHFWTFNYPIVGENGKLTGQTLSFSTTRPETMFGDTAICVNPKDERYTHLIGQQVRIPLNGRDIPIIADGLLARMDKGTGVVKVTPAHDYNDYACGLRNNLEQINILNPDGTMTEDCGICAGLDRYDARKKVVEEMERLGHFEGVEDREIPLKHSDRSKTPVEPYLSDQWFVRMDELAQSAIEAAEDGRVKFFPNRYAKTYLDWLGEKRDWCISRQLWWGHRIPVWSKVIATGQLQQLLETTEIFAELKADLLNTQQGQDILSRAGNDQLEVQLCAGPEPESILMLACVNGGFEELESALGNAGFEQDPDVLDTWFSSALWPHATLGWPDHKHNPPTTDTPAPSGNHNDVLDFFYPGSVLVTSRDIITLWVARMVLTGLYNMNDIPFSHVCIHPKILDGHGQTMSKSKGNGVDPMELIDRYGTDAVRFTIASIAGETQDVKLPVSYEHPETGEVVPQTIAHQKAIPAGGEKPRVKFPKSKSELQYPSPWFTPDEGEPVARLVSERFEYGRNFCNKFWNATRFAMLNLDGYTPGQIDHENLALEDRWILSRLVTVQAEIEEYLGRYQLDGATRTLRDFIWNEFCDWYLEMLKPRLREDAQKAEAQRVLVGVIDTLLRLLHPFVPFITEELWHQLAKFAPVRGLVEPAEAEESAIIARWPSLPKDWRDSNIENRIDRLKDIVISVRNMRSIYGISPGEPLKLYLRASSDIASDVQNVSGQFDNLAKIVLEAAGAEVERPQGSASFTLGEVDGYIPLAGVIDIQAELDRQHKEAEKLQKLIKGHEAKLSNENFTSKAPPQVVADVRETLSGWQSQLASVNEVIAQLQG